MGGNVEVPFVCEEEVSFSLCASASGVHPSPETERRAREVKLNPLLSLSEMLAVVEGENRREQGGLFLHFPR